MEFPINFMDAIDALKMSVGLSTAQAVTELRSTTELEYIAADITRDGTVNYIDAIEMLKASVGLGLDGPNGPTFLAIDHDYTNTAMDEYTVYAPAVTTRDNVAEDIIINLDVILTGDITGVM